MGMDVARLLMNLILSMHGFPPAIIDLNQRLSYLESLELAQLKGCLKQYYTFIP